LAAIQVQIQALLATIGEEEGGMAEGSNTRSNRGSQATKIQ